MLKINSFSNKGVKATDVSLPKEWEEKLNPALLAQAMRVYIDRSHVGLRKAQTRAEVKRTGKKLYSQKGTGGARHGSRRAPIFVGGGVAHGPRPVSRVLTLPKAMKRKVLAVAMTQAVKENRVTALPLGAFKKTKEITNLKSKIKLSNLRKTTYVLGKENMKNVRVFRNIKEARVINIKDMNAFDIFFGGNILMDKDIFEKKVEKKETVKKGSKVSKA